MCSKCYREHYKEEKEVERVVEAAKNLPSKLGAVRTPTASSPVSTAQEEPCCPSRAAAEAVATTSGSDAPQPGQPNRHVLSTASYAPLSLSRTPQPSSAQPQLQ